MLPENKGAHEEGGHAASSSGWRRTCGTFRGDVVTNGDDHHAFIQQWNGHEARLLLAEGTHTMNQREKSEEVQWRRGRSHVPEELPVASMDVDEQGNI